MAKRPKRPLKERTAKGAGASAAVSPASAEQPRSGRPQGAKGVVIQMNPEGWQVLRILAIKRGTSLQNLGIELFNDWLERHGEGRPIVSPFGTGTPYGRGSGKA
jgi:hypothetical protein